MTTSFPAMRPTGRRVTQGQYPVKRFTTIAGTGTSRIYGSQPFNAALELEFDNISDNEANGIVAAYEEARGSFGALSLPDAIWDGMDLSLRVKLEGSYVWRFADQPEITSVRPGLSSMRVRLEGQRDG